MPKIVDHAARRTEIVEACLRVVSRSGLAAATTREIAKEAGVSHGIIAHYFDGKDEILRAALDRSYETLAARIDLHLAGLSGTQALRRAVFDALPLDDEARTGEQIELAFWAYAMGDAEIADERWRSYAQWRRLLEVLIRDAQTETGRRIAEPAALAEALIAFLDGVGAEAVLYPDRLTPDRIRTMTEATLTAFGFAQDEQHSTADAC